jgi:hypothetical protein
MKGVVEKVQGTFGKLKNKELGLLRILREREREKEE